MIIAQSAKRLMENFLSECRVIGLKFAANVHFWIQSYFFIKKIDANRAKKMKLNLPFGQGSLKEVLRKEVFYLPR